MNLEKTVKWLGKTQGRDKLCKALQYLCRFFSSYYLRKSVNENANGNSSFISLQFTSFYQSVKEARKLFRLFKSINQYQKMVKLLLDEALNFQEANVNFRSQVINVILKLLAKICFFFYWLFDNISILSKIKLFKKNHQKYGIISSSFWFFALIFSVITLVYELRNFESKFQRYLKTKLQNQLNQQNQSTQLQQNPKSVQDQKKQKKIDIILHCIKYSFDLLPAGKDSLIFLKVFKIDVPEEVVGFGGFVSAAISTYQVYTS